MSMQWPKNKHYQLQEDLLLCSIIVQELSLCVMFNNRCKYVLKFSIITLPIFNSICSRIRCDYLLFFFKKPYNFLSVTINYRIYQTQGLVLLSESIRGPRQLIELMEGLRFSHYLKIYKLVLELLDSAVKCISNSLIFSNNFALDLNIMVTIFLN